MQLVQVGQQQSKSRSGSGGHFLNGYSQLIESRRKLAFKMFLHTNTDLLEY